MEPNSVDADMSGGFFHTGGSSNDKHDAQKEASTGKWIYLALADMLELAGIHTTGKYIQVRRQNITSFIVNRPIFDLCGEGGRGFSNHQFCWEQPFDFEEARASVSAKANVVSIDEKEE